MMKSETRSNEGGYVLLVVLFVLLAVSLLGISGVRQTGLQMQMAHNHQDYQVAFQAAEAALSHGEWLIANRQSFAVEVQPPNLNQWPFQSNAAVTVGLTQEARLAASPQVLIGQPTLRILGTSGSGAFCEKTYPVTGFAVGYNAQARVALRSYYSVIDDCSVQ